MTTDLDLDAIQARAEAATPGPWDTYQYGGDSLIEIAADLEDTGCGYSARRTICRFDEEPLDNDPTHREWTAEEDWAQVQSDAKFIAVMSPEVAKALVAEVRQLRAEVGARPADAIEYSIRIPDGTILGDGWTFDLRDQEARLERYRCCWPEAVLVQRAVHYSEWAETQPAPAAQPRPTA
ncbi:hypothetical protein [Streptomyces misionensis]|uniref:hypothetical protein n=1 Tax=Streptomyces misionensis TaxID=67331 RepID=UPI00396B8D3D